MIRYDWNGEEWVQVEDVPQQPQPMQPVYVVNQPDTAGRAVGLLLAWILAFMWLITAPCWFMMLAFASSPVMESVGEAGQTVGALVVLTGTAALTLAPMAFALYATVRRP